MSDIDNRVVMYYQTHYRNGAFVSPLPMIGYVTHVLLAAFHLNMGNVGPDIVHLNDYMPSADYFAPMWPELAQVQGNGTKVMGMLGGAAGGTYDCLTDELFDTYYPPLRDVILDYNLDGMDLDVEQWVSPAVIERIITTMKSDFGDEFIITLAPVATALTEGGNLSGFNYIDLEAKLGHLISFYNAQFYSGFGSFFPEDQYVKIVEYEQGIDPGRITATVLTNSANGYGYISTDSVVASIKNLMTKYGTQWGGVGGWEYFNSLPDSSQPWQWAVTMKEAMAVQKAKMLKAAKEKESREEENRKEKVNSRMFRL
ncbi:glycoside hydrolase family 18 protein [Cylindrobasidium torrendii FP15055 ss-10]|uniref:Glycoside hydrolase family 18 protein n=1 Tax=Cylindrobasidium torrendii FP15055 ss-10 TaxID=1314674 RepID=A0A0D7B939_9AGAR|nr:glycoside hydrolase family 18 protein [Cylindrobasidium torrendii FP15055 ss-10]